MSHYAALEFWQAYRQLPESVRQLSDRAFDLLKENPRHLSLHLKKAGKYWSARIGLHHRTIGADVVGGILWFWIGTHADYDERIR